VVIAVVALGSSGGSSTTTTPAQAAAAARPGGGEFRGAVLQPAKPAPGIDLHSSTGALVQQSAERGRATLVTFMYANCPDVCPLTAERLRQSLALLGPRAKEVRIIAVSVDPKGDTRAAVRAFLAKHGMTGRMQYLIGTTAQLTPTWKRWGVTAITDSRSSSFVSHSALVYGIDGSGRIRTIYPSNLTPADVAHDVPLLAAQ
jgi:protein SCO1